MVFLQQYCPFSFGFRSSIISEVQKGIVLFILAVIMLLIANFVFRHWIVTIIDLLIYFIQPMTHIKSINKKN